MFNVLAYADDIVLLAPSWRGLRCLLDLLTNHASKINMVINTSKSVCMVFFPSNPSKIVAKSFPQFHVGLVTLQFVSSFKYLGHRISANGSDDDDIQREICNMFMRVNVLIRRFCKCSVAVKCVLFKSFCLCLYDAALWSKYSVGKLNKLRSCYNKCIKNFFGYRRNDSMTQVLIDTGLPCFDDVLAKYAFTFHIQWSVCNNRIIRHL
jgi:hypothetical protein